MAKVIVSIPDKDDRRFKSWRKLLTGVDREQKGGYAFEGSWLQAGRKEELEPGSCVLLYDESGSMKHHYARVWLAVVDASGELTPVEDGKGPIRSSGADWALNIRDRVAAALAARDTAREETDDTAGYCPFCGSSQVEKYESEDGEKVKCLDCGRTALIIVEHEG